MGKQDFYVTTFCNHPHRLADGKPLNHQCYVLPTEALHAERAGDNERAAGVMAAWKKRKPHNGIRTKGH